MGRARIGQNGASSASRQQTERLCAMTAFADADYIYPAERLTEAWGHLLMAQHHDGWICTAAGEGERNWAWKGSAQIYAMEHILEGLKRKALIGKTDFESASANDGEIIRVFNILGQSREACVSIPMTSLPGTCGLRVVDADGQEIESQYIANRLYKDNSKNAGELQFIAKLPGFGYTSFSVQEIHEPGDNNIR